MRTHSILWAVPFVSFLMGYYSLHVLYTIPEIATPSVVGKQLPEAVKILSDYNLNARLMAEKEDPDLPDYTIVSQTPRQDAKIKAHQSVFLVLTRQPEKPVAPHLIGETAKAIQQKTAKNHIRCKTYPIASHHPTGHCIAQFPRPEDPVEDNFLICYISSGNKKMVLWPDFRGKTLESVQEFLAEHLLVPEIQGSPGKGSEALIADQRPLPGTIVDLSTIKKPTIQLYIR